MELKGKSNDNAWKKRKEGNNKGLVEVKSGVSN